MPGQGTQGTTLHVDPAMAQRATEAYEAELEREVQASLKKDSHMDAAQLAAYKADMEKKAGDALARADASDKAAKDAERKAADADKKAGDALAAVQALKDEQKRAGDAAAAITNAETLRRAKLLAQARGFKAGDADTEAARLAALGPAAVDELLRATPAPAADALGMQVGGQRPAGDAQPAKVQFGATPDGRTSATISDRSLTVPTGRPWA